MDKRKCLVLLTNLCIVTIVGCGVYGLYQINRYLNGALYIESGLITGAFLTLAVWAFMFMNDDPGTKYLKTKPEEKKENDN
jgi:hypothetical protein